MPRSAAPECALCLAKGTCFFHELEGDAFEAMRKSRIANVYRKRQVVFYEGHRPHGVYLVCSGRVKVYKSDRKGHQLTMRIAERGDLLGYRSLVAGDDYSATAEAMEESNISYLDEPTFRGFLAKHNVLAIKLMRHLAHDVRGAEDKARDMALKPSRERLAELLLLLAATHGKAGKAGTVIKASFTRQDLAEMSGLAQETVIRLLSELEAEKIVALEGREITILSEARLRKETVLVT